MAPGVMTPVYTLNDITKNAHLKTNLKMKSYLETFDS